MQVMHSWLLGVAGQDRQWVLQLILLLLTLAVDRVLQTTRVLIDHSGSLVAALH
jgi:hypothetical protein